MSVTQHAERNSQSPKGPPISQEYARSSVPGCAELLRSAQSQGGGELEARVMLADPLSRGNRALLEAAGAAQGLAYGEMPLPQILPGLEDCVLVNMVLAEEV